MLCKYQTQKEKDRERQRRRRSQLTEQQLEVLRAKDRESKRLRRATESLEQKKIRRQKDREMHRLFRAHQSHDQKQERLKRERDSRRRARAQEKLALPQNWLNLEIQVSSDVVIKTNDTVATKPATIKIVRPEVILAPVPEPELTEINSNQKNSEHSDDDTIVASKVKDCSNEVNNSNNSPINANSDVVVT